MLPVNKIMPSLLMNKKIILNIKTLCTVLLRSLCHIISENILIQFIDSLSIIYVVYRIMLSRFYPPWWLAWRLASCPFQLEHAVDVVTEDCRLVQAT